MERRQIEYFVAVVDHGGFSRAAAEIHITQPALSQGIAQLEKELGTLLFRRTTRGVVLTAAGKAAIEPARQALRGLGSVQTAVSEVMGVTGGTLDIASLPTLAHAPVSALVAEFRQRHPGVSVTIQAPSQTRVPEVAEMVRQGVCELGVTEGEEIPRGFVSLSLGRQDFVAVLPPGTTLANDDHATWEEVMACGLVVGPWWESSRPAAHLDRTYGRRSWRHHIAVRTDHRDATIPLVVSGAGAAFLPRFAARIAGAAGALVADLRPALWRSAVLIRADDPVSPAGRAFWEMAEEISGEAAAPS